MAAQDTRQEVVKTINRHVWFKPEHRAAWVSMPEHPTAEEILGPQTSADDLPHNPVHKPRESKDELLEASYRILREEGKEGLRFSVNRYRNALRSGRQEKDIRDDDFTCIYTEVHLKSYLLSRLGPIARVSFSTRKANFLIKWQQSRRLVPGSLLAISTATDNFEKVCKIATVAQRPFKDGLDQNPPLVDLLWANPEDSVFDPAQKLVMIESRSGYFESVRHALIGLQHAADTDSPLDKYLVGQYKTDTATSFVQQNPITDLSSLVTEPLENGTELSECNILKGIPDLGENTTLDDSQLEALQRMVTKELAIVQGPPGTGKTFTSIAAIKVVLASRTKSKNAAPIIVSAQTNHALDQLLSLCLEAGAKIMRIGGRTKSPEISEYTLYQIRQNAPRRIDPKWKTLEAARRGLIEEIQQLVADVFGDHLVDPTAAFEAGVLSEAQYESLHDDSMETTTIHKLRGPFSLWLGGSVIAASTLRAAKHYEELLHREFENYPPPEELELQDDEDDLKNIAEDDEDEDRIKGVEILLEHVWTGKDPGSARNWRRKAERILDEVQDLFEVDPELRGGLYQVIQSRLVLSLTDKFAALLKRYDEVCKELKSLKWFMNTQLVSREHIDIVGCTTTGLTKHRGFLAALLPSILLVEEAAETREANIVSALYPSLQQLVLIGDHQQLAPQCDIRWLGKEPFNLNVSLFERMVNLGMGYTMLSQQRRMRPEFRRILNEFYPELRDHPVVINNRADVPGMGGQNFWFFDYNWPDGTNSELSKVNEQEAQMIVHFFAYLVANNVSPDHITILTFYNGQRKLLLHKLKKHPSLLGLKLNVFTVDSYQGEENEIVLLSLVRSPGPDGEPLVGFVEDQRRAIVAVSRARRGFYLFGNLVNLVRATEQSRQVWGRVWNGFTLQSAAKRSLGLPLVCQKHNAQIWIKDIDDWGDNAGGCDRKCGEIRDCGHPCTLKCHFLDHSQLGCSQPCPKELLCGHKCQMLCGGVCHCDCAAFKQLRLISDRQRAQAIRAAQAARATAAAQNLVLNSSAVSNSSHSSPVAHPLVPREFMSLEGMLIADGAKQSTMLACAKTNLLNSPDLSDSTKSSKASSWFHASGNASPSKQWEYGQSAAETQARFIADVRIGDEVLRLERATESKNHSPAKETKIVDTYRPATIVDSKRYVVPDRIVRTIAQQGVKPVEPPATAPMSIPTSYATTPAKTPLNDDNADLLQDLLGSLSIGSDPIGTTGEDLIDL